MYIILISIFKDTAKDRTFYDTIRDKFISNNENGMYVLHHKDWVEGNNFWKQCASLSKRLYISPPRLIEFQMHLNLESFS